VGGVKVRCECPQCFKRFNSLRELQVHVEEHLKPSLNLGGLVYAYLASLLFLGMALKKKP